MLMLLKILVAWVAWDLLGVLYWLFLVVYHARQLHEGGARLVERVTQRAKQGPEIPWPPFVPAWVYLAIFWPVPVTSWFWHLRQEVRDSNRDTRG